MKISVCMATYNGEKFLKEQVDSILKQLSAKDELIISDDGSTDLTLKILDSYDDDRIKLFHSNHKNLIFNFENALIQASGDLIFLSDQDDIWLDNKVSTSLESLKRCALVFSNALMFQGANKDAGELFFKDSSKKTGILSNLVKAKYLGATLAFRRSLLEKALPFPRKIPMHDIWLGLIAEATASTCYIDKPLILYRRHDETASTTGGSSDNSLFVKLKFRYNLIISLIKRLW